MRELEITPDPADPAIAAAIARALERFEHEQGRAEGAPRPAATSSTMPSPDVLLGAGLYETVRVSQSAALHGERHLVRMTSSAVALGLPLPSRSSFASGIAVAAGEGEVVRVRLHARDGEPELRAEGRLARTAEPQRLTV